MPWPFGKVVALASDIRLLTEHVEDLRETRLIYVVFEFTVEIGHQWRHATKTAGQTFDSICRGGDGVLGADATVCLSAVETGIVVLKPDGEIGQPVVGSATPDPPQAGEKTR